ncbi:MAG TPA: hypothetical protein VGK81_09505, partial [Anaerolineae bacterium]|jgi:hypothetical protein
MNLRTLICTSHSSRTLQDRQSKPSILYRRYALLGIVFCYVVLALIQSFTLPVFEGPDEQRHYAYAR